MSIINFIFDIPFVFNTWRSIIHNGFKNEKAIIRSNILQNDYVLDFGCGTGHYSKLFRDNRYVGIDVDNTHLKHAINRFPGKKFLVFDANFKVPCKEKSFDSVLCLAVIHHIPSDGLETFRDEVLRVLRNDGKLLITDHLPPKFQENLWSKFLFQNDRGKFPRLPQQIIKYFTGYARVSKKYEFKVRGHKMYAIILKKLSTLN